MLGHKLHYYLNKVNDFNVTTTIRSKEIASKVLQNGYVETDVSIEKLGKIREIIRSADYVVNSIGIVKQIRNVPFERFIEVNGIFPHRIASMCHEVGAKMVQISTDCVFDGTRGYYSEIDHPDATDPYGYSKAVGEVGYGDNITIRTSIIGSELESTNGLFEWFRTKTRNRVQGYANAIWSGLTCDQLALILISIIKKHPSLKGIYHIGIREPISKLDLLRIFNETFSLQKIIEPYYEFKMDRSLNTSKFLKDTGLNVQPIREQISEMVDLRNQ